MGQVLIWAGLLIIAVLISLVIYIKSSFKDSAVKAIPYDDNLKIYTGGGCNSIVLTSG